MTESSVSIEFVRQLLKAHDKFEQKNRLLGHLFAVQDVRAIGKLHTWYPGQRTEFDFTKYGVFLYPNSNWNKPELYFDGLGVDHTSGVIGSFVTTTSPTSRDIVRLYKRYVMPKSTWLPSSLLDVAQLWDVFGLPHLVAMDNGAEFISNATTIMLLMSGVVILRIPPRRGDLKGTVERCINTVESRYIHHMPGYIPKVAVGLNPKYSKVRERAKSAARLTVQEYEHQLAQHIVEYNHEKHPRLKIPRIHVYRNGLEMAPPLLLTGHIQQRMTFALTYEVKLTREGVEVETLKFNSEDLHAAYRSYSGTVVVKLDPDDVRSVLVIVPQYAEPIEAFLTTYSLTERVSIELLQMAIKANNSASAAAQTGKPVAAPMHFGSVLADLQEATKLRIAGTTARKEIQAVTQAAAMPPAARPPAAPSLSLDELLKGSELDDEA